MNNQLLEIFARHIGTALVNSAQEISNIPEPEAKPAPKRRGPAKKAAAKKEEAAPTEGELAQSKAYTTAAVALNEAEAAAIEEEKAEELTPQERDRIKKLAIAAIKTIGKEKVLGILKDLGSPNLSGLPDAKYAALEEALKNG